MTSYVELLGRAAHYDELHLKIGIDTGVFFCELARLHPSNFYLGIEVRRVAVKVAHERAKDLHNTVVLHADAEPFTSAWPFNATFDTIHIYHPTPDPRTVGLRHPLLNRNFVADCARILRAWGALRLVTARLI